MVSKEELIDKIYKILKRGEENSKSYFFDRENLEILFVENKYLEKEDLPVPKKVRELIEKLDSNYDNRYLPIEPFCPEYKFKARKEFAFLCKKENAKEILLGCLRGKGAFKKYKETLIELGLYEEYIAFENKLIHNAAVDFLTMNHIYEKEATRECLVDAYNTALAFKDLKPWELFNDVDPVVIKILNKTYYLSIMGKAGMCYGVSIYDGEEGFNAYSMMANASLNQLDSNLINSLQSCYTIYFDKLEDCNEDNLELLKKLNLQSSDGIYPDINFFEVGYFPTNKINDEDCLIINRVLKTFIRGVKPYLNKEKEIDVDNQTLTISYKNSKKIEREVSRKISFNQDYGFEYDDYNFNDNDEYAYIDREYELNLNVLNRPMYVENNIGLLWIYNLVIYDVKERKIVNIISETNDFADPLESIQMEVLAYFKENGLPRQIDINSGLLIELLSSLLPKTQVVLGEPSKKMQEILANIQALSEIQEPVA